jgi:hypothetical protein
MPQEDYALGEQLIVGDMFVANSIYIDIGFLKYIALGRIIVHSNINSSIYNEVVSIVKNEAFKERNTNDLSIILESVSNIESVLTEEPQTAQDDGLFVVSPSFAESISVVENNLIINDNSRRVLSKTLSDTVIHINISSLPNLSDRICRQIADEYANTFNTPVRLLRKPLTDKDTQYDVYYVDNIRAFNEIMQQPLNVGKFIEKFVFCQRVLPLKHLPDIPVEVLPALFARLEMIMTAACKFQFLQPFTLL